MRTAVIHQPDFLPYLGFFHRFLSADVWVVLDQVQFLHCSKSWHHRDKIKGPQGERWLTVPVAKSPQKTPINQVRLAPTPWREEHLNLLHACYAKAPCYREILPHLERLYCLPCERLVEFNLASIAMLQGLLDLPIPSVLASSLAPEGKGNALMVDLTRKVEAGRYLSGVGARGYFEPEPYRQAGIEVVWQDFAPPLYPQLYGEFRPCLSSIDALFNVGIEGTRRLLRST